MSDYPVDYFRDAKASFDKVVGVIEAKFADFSQHFEILDEFKFDDLVFSMEVDGAIWISDGIVRKELLCSSEELTEWLEKVS